MTLAQWTAAAPILVSSHGGAIVVPDCWSIHPMRAQLWSLEDYIVSSVTGGAIWLIPRAKPLTWF